MATELIESVARTGGIALLALMFVVVFAESAVLLDLVVPGEVGVIIVASAVAADASTPLWLLVVVGTLGGVAGDSFGFWLGRRFGVSIVERWRWSRRRVLPRLRRAHRYFDRKGGPAVAGARWVGALRAVVPVVAGAAAMPFRRFIAWDAPSTAAWTAAVAAIGFTFGDDVAAFMDRAGAVTTTIVIASLAAAALWRRHRRASSAHVLHG